MKVFVSNYTNDSRVAVYPFTRQYEGQEVIIGRLDTAVFLVLPSEAIELLDYLALGKTVGEANSLYQQNYGEVPALEDLLDILEQKGFVQPLDQDGAAQSHNILKKTVITLGAKPPTVRFHYANFPQSLARNLFSRHVLLGCGVLIGLALIALTIDPSLLPGWSAHFFQKNLTLMRLVLTLLNYSTLFLHEMAHLLAARAIGVSSRLGISHRLWYLVAETDMTGVWSIPRNQRYLPFLAGPLLDATSASVLVLLLFAQGRGWLMLHPVVFQLGRAMLLIYLMRLLWQCYLFVRTDFYFVIANFFRCKSLMKDTEVFLRNQRARLFRSLRRVDQSHIPVGEMRVIRWYALLWIFGRVAALGSLFFITIPLIWHYYLAIFAVLKAGFQANPYAFVDGLLMAFLVLTPQGLGFWLWIRSFRTLQR